MQSALPRENAGAHLTLRSPASAQTRCGGEAAAYTSALVGCNASLDGSVNERDLVLKCGALALAYVCDMAAFRAIRRHEPILNIPTHAGGEPRHGRPHSDVNDSELVAYN